MKGRSYRAGIFILALMAVAAACGPNRRIIESGNENPPANVFRQDVKPAVSTFEEDIKAMRTADFYFIYVFRRRDRLPFDAEDKQFLLANIPTEVNRRQLSDEGRALIVGSNFRVPEEMLENLRSRFEFADHSGPGVANSNSCPTAK